MSTEQARAWIDATIATADLLAAQPPSAKSPEVRATARGVAEALRWVIGESECPLPIPDDLRPKDA